MKYVLSLVACVTLAASLWACATARRPEDRVSIAQESALILWDPVRKIEHFIREAAFDTSAPDFGFIVPTPSVPKLFEAKNVIFGTMNRWTEPKIVHRTVWKMGSLLNAIGCGRYPESATSKSEGKSEVRVLAKQQVSGFDAVVLEADNAEALSDWLKKNGYVASPELASWFVPYIAKHWKLTAFKIAHDPKTGKRLETLPVRMSFETDQPFYPYREPLEPEAANQKPGPRLLRVFFVGPDKVSGELRDGTSWPGKTIWSDRISAEQSSQMLKELGMKEGDAPSPAWMTMFEDWSSPRPGTEEIDFQSAKDPSPVHRPDIVYNDPIEVPIELVIVPLAFVGVWLWRRRRG